jgi:hypothetical protein
MPTPRTPVKSATRRMEPAEAVPAPPAQSNQRLSAAASLVPLQQGLYALTIDPSALTEEEFSGVRTPIVQVSAPPDPQGRCVEIIGAAPHEGWLRGDGGTVILRSPPGGGHALVSVYSLPGQSVQLPPIEVQRRDRPRGSSKPPAVAETADQPIEVRTEIVLHMEQLGDRRFSGEGWIGNRSKRLRVEAFSIRPIDSLTPRDIEFMALGPNRRQTPWVTDAKLCGTRGRGMPLTGFAIRLAAHVRDQFDIVYQGAFFDSGIVGPCRNGELCIPPVGDDPLEAINVRLMRRCGERGRDPV